MRKGDVEMNGGLLHLNYTVCKSENKTVPYKQMSLSKAVSGLLMAVTIVENMSLLTPLTTSLT
jgi:hypothetical protein